MFGATMHEVLLAESGDTSSGSPLPGLAIMLFGAFFYFMPLIIAATRKVRDVGSVAVVNVFLGWSCIGWIVALAMALRTVDGAPQGFAQYPPNYPPPYSPPPNYPPQDYPQNWPPAS